MIVFRAFGKSSKKSFFFFGIFLQHVLVNVEMVECPGVMGCQGITEWYAQKSDFNTHSFEKMNFTLNWDSSSGLEKVR